MAQTNQTQPIATAFISCSLRQEDKPFVDLIERIVQHFGITPIGTVGRYSAAPVNTAALMKTNIPLADMIVIAATPRYFQTDLKTGESSYGVSEMVHIETGMAYMADKPVIVFVQEGTNIGNFLPNVTQYVVLNGRQQNLEEKWVVINSLLNNALGMIKTTKDKKSAANFGKFVAGSLAVFGGLKLLDSLSDD